MNFFKNWKIVNFLFFGLLAIVNQAVTIGDGGGLDLVELAVGYVPERIHVWVVRGDDAQEIILWDGMTYQDLRTTISNIYGIDYYSVLIVWDDEDGVALDINSPEELDLAELNGKILTVMQYFKLI